MNYEDALKKINDHSRGLLTDVLGIDIIEANQNLIKGRMQIIKSHLSPNGHVHAASLVALADTLCGFGSYINLPVNSTGFTTIELKSNFIGMIKQGVLLCEAVPEHIGRSTHIWAATVTDATGKKIALFRCTQMILMPESGNLVLNA